ncbi:MAG: PAS domain S-box protein [Gammaproteobacteria bacterium]|nr:PAS domain S-box protein [Gammaproteobacteria bacterium]
MSRRFISFTVFSLIGLLLVSFLLVDIFQRVSRGSIESHFYEHNILLARVLRNGLAESYIKGLLEGGAKGSAADELVTRFEKDIRAYVADIPVAKIKIFNRTGVTVYSSTSGERGRDASGNPGVQMALEGLTAGSMVQRDKFNSFDRIVEHRDLYQQYIPIRALDAEQVEGAFEIYSDVTPLVKSLEMTRNNFVLSLLVILGTFFLVQVWLYHRTDAALVLEKKQTEGYLRELEQSREQLESRVAERTRELESSRFFLQSVIDGIANPLFVIQSDLQVSLMNEAAKSLIPPGCRPEQYAYCYQISHGRNTPCDGYDHPCSFAEVIAKQTTAMVQHNHFDADHNPIIVEVTTTPLHSQDGVLTGVIEVQHDVTELVSARHKLARSEARLKAIMDHVPDAIFTVNSAAIIESANQAAAQLFEEPLASLLDRNLHTLFCKTDGVEELLTADNKVKEGCATRAGEFRFPVDLWVSTFNLEDSQRFVAVVRDITDRKMAERELEQTRQQYYHQEKMAAIGQLAAGILHEVGNPIAAIAGATQELRVAEASASETESGCGLDAAVAHNLRLIEEHTERLAKITRDIADFASPRPRKRELTDINGLVSSTIRLLGYDRRFRGTTLKQTLDSQLPAVECVPDQITQVLMNLLINGLDAANGREVNAPTVEVITRVVERGIDIEVKDNGEGMDTETRAHAFEPFYTTKEPGKGTGLGLSLCDSIIASHGGSLRIDSEPGKGTSVFVQLHVRGELTGMLESGA